jgi:hypothetical protein
VFGRHPLAIEVNRGAVVGGGVEIFRRRAIHVRRPQHRVGCAFDVAAEHGQLGEQILQPFVGVGLQFQNEVRTFFVLSADVEPENLVLRAVFDDGGEDGLEVAGIDQVAFGLDGFGNHAELLRDS